MQSHAREARSEVAHTGRDRPDCKSIHMSHSLDSLKDGSIGFRVWGLGFRVYGLNSFKGAI